MALFRQCLHAQQPAIVIPVLPDTMFVCKGSQEGDQGSNLQLVSS